MAVSLAVQWIDTIRSLSFIGHKCPELSSDQLRRGCFYIPTDTICGYAITCAGGSISRIGSSPIMGRRTEIELNVQTPEEARVVSHASPGTVLEIAPYTGPNRGPGAPTIVLPPAQNILGAGEFSAPIGTPQGEARSVIVQEPRNQFTPQSGYPGGTYNYNTLLSSLIKWDLESWGTAVNPAANQTIAEVTQVLAGVWAVSAMGFVTTAGQLGHFELEIQNAAVLKIVRRWSNTGEAMAPVEEIVIMVGPPNPLAGASAIRVKMVAALAAAAVSAGIRAKQLAAA